MDEYIALGTAVTVTSVVIVVSIAGAALVAVDSTCTEKDLYRQCSFRQQKLKNNGGSI